MAKIALYKAGQLRGYFVADDQATTLDASQAATFSSRGIADREARLCNLQWDLSPGEKFIVVD
jgi:hypothetical protein